MLISIIIPVFNVEKYLRKCLDSVINQTYKNLEIICIDDFSTDSSLKILQEYAQKDSRIKIIKNENNIGAGLSKNKGLKLATGNYIHYLDSDDWMNLNSYEILSKYFDDDIDIINFGIIFHDEKSKKVTKCGMNRHELFYKKVNVYNTPKSYEDFDHSTTRNLYSKEFLQKNNLYYSDYRCIEDVRYGVECMLLSRNTIFINEFLYNYRTNRKGALSSKNLFFIDCVVKDTLWANEKGKALPRDLQYHFYKHIYGFLYAHCFNGYYYGHLTFDKMKNILLECIDLEHLGKNDDNNWVIKARESNKIKFFFSYKVKRYIRENFPTYLKMYLKLKRKVMNVN